MLLRSAFQPDISWRRLAILGLLTWLPFPRRMVNLSRRKLGGCALFCDSVRAGFVLLLQKHHWAKGTEIVFTYPTIAAMPALARAFGCVPVAVDCEKDHHPATLHSIKRRVTPRTRAIVIAPLFGCRLDLKPYRRFCDARGIVLIEDAAQGYGGQSWPEKGAAHYTLFSFGLLKKASCLRGGLLLLESRETQKELLALQRKFPVASRAACVRKWLIAVVGVLCTRSAWVYGPFERLLKMFDRRLATVLLGFMRSRREPEAKTYSKQPHPSTLAALALTLRTRRCKDKIRCCRQRRHSRTQSRLGLWPGVTLYNEAQHGGRPVFDLISTKVRLTGAADTQLDATPQARRLLDRACFVDTGYFRQ